MPGDFIGHSIPIDPKDSFDAEKYKKLHEVHALIANLVSKYLP